MAALSAALRGRSVEPVQVSRLTISGVQSISAFGPLRKAICTSLPSTASARKLRAM